MEVALPDPIAEPVEAHVHCFGHLLPDGFVGEAGGAFISEMKGCGVLRVSEFVEGLAEWKEIFCG